MAINYRPQLSGDERRELLWTGLKNYGLYGQGASEAELLHLQIQTLILLLRNLLTAGLMER